MSSMSLSSIRNNWINQNTVLVEAFAFLINQLLAIRLYSRLYKKIVIFMQNLGNNVKNLFKNKI